MDAELQKKLTVDDQPPPAPDAPEREFGHVIFFHPDPEKPTGSLGLKILSAPICGFTKVSLRTASRCAPPSASASCR